VGSAIGSSVPVLAERAQGSAAWSPRRLPVVGAENGRDRMIATLPRLVPLRIRAGLAVSVSSYSSFTALSDGGGEGACAACGGE
jgi:hypothetical protein